MPTKSDLVEQLLRRRGVRRPGVARIGRRPESFGALPLSFAQERIWFLDQLEQGTALYNMGAAFRLRGRLDVEALERAGNEVVRRHEVLRTTFAVCDGRPVQVIRPELRVPLPVDDISHLPAEEREPEMLRRATLEMRAPFDLAAGPLCRVRLLRMTDDEHVLLATTHHIIGDSWSNGVFFAEMSALYDACLRGRESPLPELEIQYADYALWQREHLSGEGLARQKAYWLEQLEGAPGGLELPTDRPRPAVESYRGAHLRFVVPGPLREGVEALSRRCGLTPFMVLLAAFKVLLFRYSGQADVLVGSPIASRTREEIEPLMGFFVNTLVLRTDLSGDPTFTDLLDRVRRVAMEAFEHQDVPFEMLVQELDVERSMSRSPLFQLMFSFQNTPRKPLRLAGLEVERLQHVESGISKFDLTLFMSVEDGELVGLAEYATDLFDESTVVRLVRHFQTLLAGAVEDPEGPVSRLPLLSGDETRRMLVEWNDTRAPRAASSCVHHLVERRAELAPDAVAVVFEESRLSYRELDRAANRMARHLRKLGVGPDALVAVCMERSLELAVTLLAVAKAGGATAAVDPAYPEDRIAHILTDAGAVVLLTRSGLLGRLPDCGTRMVDLDAAAGEIAREDDSAPEVALTPANLLYAIYTSGSTGLPKGIGVTHEAIVNLLEWQSRTLAAHAARTLQFAAFGFCVSFQEMFGTWVSGGTLVMPSEDTRRNLEEVMDLVAREGIERLYLPFAALKHLAEMHVPGRAGPTQLRDVVTAGEQLQVTDSVRRFFAGLDGCALHNHYGASETHVVTSLTLRESPGAWPRVPSVGRPIASVRAYVLDPHLQPVPVGVTGELYVAGPCVPRGYVRDPALTALKLVPDPFADAPGERLYRMGDLARYRSDGQIEVVGRADTQVKIRGFRIELGEIEAVARQHPRVRDIAVVAREVDGGSKLLLAYPVYHDAGADDGAGLREFLRERLPEHMVPAAFLPLPALPINANGKLDPGQLPAPDVLSLPGREEYSPPTTPTEEALARIWSEVLQVERVGVHDNFFDLGGHSLRATQVVSRIREALHVDVALRYLFMAPTLAELARTVELKAPRTEPQPAGIAPVPRARFRTSRRALDGAVPAQPGAGEPRT